ncbi:MAG: hypothetical protein Q4Q20_02475 [Methanocorpusculum sp.]|nr:hypothetical protein [Methanocorpusculum sp.]
MKIKGVNVRIPPAVWVVFGLFAVLFLVLFLAGGCTTPAVLYWGIPLALFMVILAGISNFSLSSQYVRLLPEYESSSNLIPIRKLTLQMEGKPVRVRGVVQKVSGALLGRPRIIIYDGSAACIVFRSIPLSEKIAAGDNIEAVGMVVKKYLVAGAISVHGIGVRKCDADEFLPADYADEEEKKIRVSPVKIKKYN